jgi:hypothetical protein
VIEVKRTTKSNEDTSSVDIPIAPALIKQAELLVSAHSDFLTTVETMMNEWLRRQRQAFDLSSRSVQKICGSRSIIDLAQAQGEWMSECLRWTAAEIRAVGNDAVSMTWKTAQRFGQTARDGSDGWRQQSEGTARTESAASPERAAAE